ncbi:hypothetical protein R3P38DRAFT_3434010 [Favolaschia claudopus]|uniref:Uncharacterized protein n=1 Tax=Favolaschia claudopus TaxID=2862362 RepID=A0AAW0D1L1_9AGAR
MELMFENLLVRHSTNFSDPSVQGFDAILGVLFPFWSLRSCVGKQNRSFIKHVATYINTRNSPEAVYHSLRGCRDLLLSSLRTTLPCGNPNNTETSVLMAAHRLLRFSRGFDYGDTRKRGDVDGFADMIDRVDESSACPLIVSIAALLQYHCLQSCSGSTIDAMWLCKKGDKACQIHPLTPLKEEIDSAKPSGMHPDLQAEARLLNVCNFLENCRSDAPYMARETLAFITAVEPHGSIRPFYQRQFARVIHDMTSYQDISLRDEMLEELVSSKMLAIYTQTRQDVAPTALQEGGPNAIEFLDDENAVKFLLEAFHSLGEIGHNRIPAAHEKIRQIVSALEDQQGRPASVYIELGDESSRYYSECSQ